MKTLSIHIIFTLFVFFISPIATYSQIDIAFEKEPFKVSRNKETKTELLKIMLKSDISTDLDIAIKKLDGDDKAGLFENVITHKFTPSGRKDFPMGIEVIGDTTITETRIYHFIMEYAFLSGGTTIKKLIPLTLEVKPFSKSNPQEVEEDEFPKNDFLTFAGANIDPLNNGAKLTNFSFEAIFKVQVCSLLNMRIGGYSNRNFSADSASLPQTNYIRLNPSAPTIVDTSRLAVQQYRIDRQSTTRSYGFYVDFMFPVLINTDKVRLSPFIHAEYVRRTVTTNLDVAISRIVDTVTYTKALEQRRISTSASLVSNENIIAPQRTIDHYYLTTGIVFEWQISKKFGLFFQPMYGYSERREKLSTRPGYTYMKYETVSAKILANIKLIGVTVAADLRDITSLAPFFNISVGIPLSINDILARAKAKE